MATLKSIKNKYLTVSDGAALGVTTNTENVSLLSFKLATADSLSKFNLVDGFSDDFQDATGIDTSGSTNENRNASNYYSGAVEGSYSIDGFTSTGNATWTVPANTSTAEILVVAGAGKGGGGDRPYLGGGGAGGIVHHATYTLASASTVYNVTVGSGGSGSSVPSVSGQNSVWDTSGTTLTMTAVGGGGGGYQSTAGQTGGSGGGSGSGSSTQAASTQGAVSGATVYGNAGGQNCGQSGGGGGGAGEAGNTDGCAHGGDGVEFSQFEAYGTSSNNTPGTPGSGSGKGWFGGGGGGSSEDTQAGTGGVGGGRPGMYSGDGVANGPPGTANTGGGGGAARSFDGSGARDGGSGGSGVILVKHRALAYDNMTLLSNAYTAQTQPDTARMVMDEYTSAGSSTLNTDIKAYASRDSGTTYTQITLASQGTINTNHRLLSGSVDISGQPAGTAMKYKIETLNQAVGKQTRVYGVSMAWA